MWQLLTRCCTLLPPNRGDIEFFPDGQNLLAGITYGADLYFSRIADEYDQLLRTTIIWCMSKCLLGLLDVPLLETEPCRLTEMTNPLSRSVVIREKSNRTLHFKIYNTNAAYGLIFIWC